MRSFIFLIIACFTLSLWAQPVMELNHSRPYLGHQIDVALSDPERPWFLDGFETDPNFGCPKGTRASRDIGHCRNEKACWSDSPFPGSIPTKQYSLFANAGAPSFFACAHGQAPRIDMPPNMRVGCSSDWTGCPENPDYAGPSGPPQLSEGQLMCPPVSVWTDENFGVCSSKGACWASAPFPGAYVYRPQNFRSIFLRCAEHNPEAMAKIKAEATRCVVAPMGMVCHKTNRYVDHQAYYQKLPSYKTSGPRQTLYCVDQVTIQSISEKEYALPVPNENYLLSKGENRPLEGMSIAEAMSFGLCSADEGILQKKSIVFQCALDEKPRILSMLSGDALADRPFETNVATALHYGLCRLRGFDLSPEQIQSSFDAGFMKDGATFTCGPDSNKVIMRTINESAYRSTPKTPAPPRIREELAAHRCKKLM